jgi:hypothetical protein
MQDKYVGDVGDFGKLTLLRHLVRRSRLRLGVVWCTVSGNRERNVDGSEKNNDGSHRAFLSYTGKHRVDHCDAELFSGLAQFSDVPRRKIERLHPFTLASSFFGTSIEDSPRQEWLKAALDRVQSEELVFFDPDNGINFDESCIPSPKHISLQELQRFWDRGQSLLIYHHLNRKKGGHRADIIGVERQLGERFNAEIRHFHFRRGTSRVLFLIIQSCHEKSLDWLSEGNLPWKALLMSKSEWAKEPIAL